MWSAYDRSLSSTIICWCRQCLCFRPPPPLPQHHSRIRRIIPTPAGHALRVPAVRTGMAAPRWSLIYSGTALQSQEEPSRKANPSLKAGTIRLHHHFQHQIWNVSLYKGYLSVVATDFPPMVAFVEGFHYSGIV